MQIDPALLEAYSRGEITRREISRQLGVEVSFGTLLAALQARGLRLPRVPRDPHSPGVELIRQLAERAVGAG